MSDTADKKATQAPQEVIAAASRPYVITYVGGSGIAETIILALHAAGYVIVPRSAVDAALERKVTAA